MDPMFFAMQCLTAGNAGAAGLEVCSIAVEVVAGNMTCVSLCQESVRARKAAAHAWLASACVQVTVRAYRTCTFVFGSVVLEQVALGRLKGVATRSTLATHSRVSRHTHETGAIQWLCRIFLEDAPRLVAECLV